MAGLNRSLALGATVLALALAPLSAKAEERGVLKAGSLNKNLVVDIHSGKIETSGDASAVSELILNRNVPITYEYISILMRTPNAFGEGGAGCVVCHNSNDPAESYRGLDLTSCKGILKGSTEEPVRPIVVPGAANKSLIRRMLRNNRMPLGISFVSPTHTPAIEAVKDWINAGAKDDKAFKKVLESFAKAGAYGTEQACVDCHMSNEEPPSFHELDLTSYKGVMLGADSILNAKTGKPPTKIVVPGKAEESALYQRLVENRMPPGIDPSIDRDTPATRILLRWIDQGAKCQ
ncbi:MAG: hypothetical protein EPN26_11035 [Rhodospirillales bacterium]|nr:MAG: hypothetical protein EPN26_11035 [Rhodospirillales bacterium]